MTILGRNFVSESPDDTERVGKEIAKNLKAGDVVLFYGGLGAGKTLMIKSICEFFGVRKDEVASPTFNILRVYRGKGGILIMHFDFYRFSERDVDFFEISDYLNEDGIVLVEWADRVDRAFFEGNVFEVKIDVKENGDRIIKVAE